MIISIYHFERREFYRKNGIYFRYFDFVIEGEGIVLHSIHLRENRQHGGLLLPLSCYEAQERDSLHTLECHWHEEMELFKVMKGSLRIQVEESVFEATAGELLFFNSEELHAAVPLEGEACCFRAVVFSPDLLCGPEGDRIRLDYILPILKGNLVMPRKISQIEPGGAEIHQCFDTIYELTQNRPERFPFLVKAEMFRLFAYLLEKAKPGDEASGSRRSEAVSGVKEAISYILKAVEKAGYEPGKDFMLAMDAASSEWKGEKKGEYVLPKAGTHFTSETLIAHWKQLAEKYPIISIEDPLDEEDWEGWQLLTKELGDKVQLVGDDLFVTNTERLAKGIGLGCGNSILIKLNQIGSVSETLEAIKMAHKAGYTAISSHRSGETGDTTIADLAVALNTCQIKTGAPSRSERVEKYNQLLRIEEELGASAVYPGWGAFSVSW